MVTIENSMETRRSVDAVFAFFADPRQLAQWQAVVQEVQVTTDGPPLRRDQGDTSDLVSGRETGADRRDHGV